MYQRQVFDQNPHSSFHEEHRCPHPCPGPLKLRPCESLTKQHLATWAFFFFLVVRGTLALPLQSSKVWRSHSSPMGSHSTGEASSFSPSFPQTLPPGAAPSLAPALRLLQKQPLKASKQRIHQHLTHLQLAFPQSRAQHRPAHSSGPAFSP